MTSTAWICSTRPRLLLPVLAVGLVAAVLAPPAVAAKPVPALKGYTATASPSVVPLPLPDGGRSVAVTLQNTAGTHPFASAEISVPVDTGLDLEDAQLVPRSGWSLTDGPTRVGRVVKRLVSTGSGTTNAVPPGGLVVVDIPVREIDGPVTVTTAIKQSNDFSGTGNEFTRSGADPVVHIGAGPAVGLAFVQQPTTVQRTTASPSSYPGLTPVLSMCPAPSVRIVDANGLTVRSGPSITVTLAAPGAGLGGTTGAATVAGVATFGGCGTGVTATTLGTGFTATASATSLSSATSTPFAVRSVHGACPGACSVPELTGGLGSTRASMQAQVDGTASSADRLTFGVAADPWSAGDSAVCDPDPESTNGSNPYRDVVTVDLSNHDKTVQLRWSKKAVQWATNNGSSQWRVCLANATPFAAAGGPATLVVTPSSSEPDWWVGTLLPCNAAALAADDPCLAGLRRNGGEQLATVSIPNRPGDPRMI